MKIKYFVQRSIDAPELRVRALRGLGALIYRIKMLLLGYPAWLGSKIRALPFYRLCTFGGLALFVLGPVWGGWVCASIYLYWQGRR